MPPRGGRGGGGRRGGAPKPGFTRIGGVDIAYDQDVQEESSGRPQPSETFPKYPGTGHPPQPRPPSAKERRQLSFQSDLRARIRRSPLFTTFSVDSVRGVSTQYSSRFGPGATMPRIPGLVHGSKRSRMMTPGMSVDPFNIMPHYSDRYDQKRRKMPRLDRQQVRVVIEFFPEELHAVLDPSITVRRVNGEAKQSRRAKNGFDSNEIEAAEADEAAAEDATADEDEDNKDRVKERKKSIVAEEGEDVDEDEGNEEGPAAATDDGEVDEQDEDDDFEDDIDGDYNAETYFNDGGDDAGDEDMDDGGGGGDYND